MSKQQPRGIRNNNAGNLRRSADKWQGLAAVQSDPDFFVFDAPIWGLRALAIVLLNYQDRHGLKTIREIINRWAPPVENNTVAYIQVVANACDVRADDVIEVRAYLHCLIKAIILHECGQQPYDDILIGQAVDMATKARA